jgi:DNA-binding response OmpR family regulator
MTEQPLTPTERRLLVVLRAAPGRLSPSALVEILYWRSDDGGPLNGKNVVAQNIYALRRKRELEIENIYTLGYRLTDADRAKLMEREAAAGKKRAAVGWAA